MCISSYGQGLTTVIHFLQSSDVTVFNLKLPFVQFSIYCYYILTLLYLIKACLVCSFNLCKKKRDAHFFLWTIQIEHTITSMQKEYICSQFKSFCCRFQQKDEEWQISKNSIGYWCFKHSERFLFLQYYPSNVKQKLMETVKCAYILLWTFILSFYSV